MKKLPIVLTITFAAATITACNSHKSSSTADSSNITTTSTTTTAKITVPDTSAKATATADSTDIKFANKAAMGGMAEVGLGELAAQKGTDPQVKHFANMMISDHTKANNELAGIAATDNIILPATVDAEHQQKWDDLNALSGNDFDKAYVHTMVAGHKATLVLMRNEATNGQSANMKKFAAKTAITVQMHLDVINKLNASMK